MLLATAARFLAGHGKGVVALDFDFEAPGLHYKLAEGPIDVGGVVPYLVATAEGTLSPPRFEEHMVSVPVPAEAGGWLRLMPAGPAPNKSYWVALKELGERLKLSDLSGRGFMALLDLQARIADELKADYLLIDARTGVTDLCGLAITVLADTVVCLFIANSESLEGTLAVVEALKGTPRLASQRPISVVPVLLRNTGRPWPDDRYAFAVTGLVDLAGGVFHVLPHDDVFGTFETPIGVGREDSPLYKAYVELFGELFPGTSAPPT